MLKGSVMFVEVPQLMWYEDKLLLIVVKILLHQ